LPFAVKLKGTLTFTSANALLVVNAAIAATADARRNLGSIDRML
jgi:hypothetical protein